MTRIFAAVDIHGSEVIWRKFIRMHEIHKVDVLMMLGDLTGKAIVPIVKRTENEWYYAPWGKTKVLHSRREVDEVIKTYRNQGYYVFETTPQEVEELQADSRKMDELFVKLMSEVLQSWFKLAEEKVPKNVKIIVSPGNDDPFEIDKVIEENDRVINPVGKVVDLDSRHELISCPWTNPTPWGTHRECSEKELKKKLEDEFKKVKNYENLICNFHAPPYNTGLDICPKLDKNLKQVWEMGSPVTYPAGSKAVREAIEKYQPLLCLHGHIHESPGTIRLGRTLCLNPGSEYESGVLRGFVVDLPPKEFQFMRVEA
ncbi:MAG: metallophosphoesterase [Candidatus Bathyarchaeia archaeon]|nr:metallophosphoesterase [Candidatus Bathyarchaeota archaeon]